MMTPTIPAIRHVPVWATELDTEAAVDGGVSVGGIDVSAGVVVSGAGTEAGVTVCMGGGDADGGAVETGVSTGAATAVNEAARLPMPTV